MDEQVNKLRALDELLRLAVAMRHHIDGIGARYGLSGPQVRLLFTLEEPMRMLAAAEATSCEPPHVTALAEQLERAGLLVRKVDPADRRARLLTLTDAGAALRNEFLPALLDDAPVLAALDPDECARLTELLQAARHGDHTTDGDSRKLPAARRPG